MSDAEIPHLPGQADLLHQLLRHLSKRTPDHVSVLGSARLGRSVLLHHVASHFGTKSNHYVAVVYWDVGRETPRDDTDFLRAFARWTKRALEPAQPDLADYLELDHDGVGDLLCLVFDELANRDHRLLAVLDGLDEALATPRITRHLWDALRALAQRPSLRLVTGSRTRRVGEPGGIDASRTSNFWGIFYDTPLRVGGMADVPGA